MLTQYTIAQQALSVQTSRALTKACTRFGSAMRLAAGRGMQDRQQTRECDRRAALGVARIFFILRSGRTYRQPAGSVA
jgi:hypothetical protein